jgi:hypothetical protein
MTDALVAAIPEAGGLHGVHDSEPGQKRLAAWCDQPAVRTSMVQRGPDARASRWSAVSRGTSSNSASATYAASWKVTFSRSSQHRGSSGTDGARSRGKVGEVGQREASAPLGHVVVADEAAQGRADLEVDLVGGRQRLSREPAPAEVAVRTIVGQCCDEDSGVNDHHGRLAPPPPSGQAGPSPPHVPRHGQGSRPPWDGSLLR